MLVSVIQCGFLKEISETTKISSESNRKMKYKHTGEKRKDSGRMRVMTVAEKRMTFSKLLKRLTSKTFLICEISGNRHSLNKGVTSPGWKQSVHKLL